MPTLSRHKPPDAMPAVHKSLKNSPFRFMGKDVNTPISSVRKKMEQEKLYLRPGRIINEFASGINGTLHHLMIVI
jgi:hypothetical protein